MRISTTTVNSRTGRARTLRRTALIGVCAATTVAGAIGPAAEASAAPTLPSHALVRGDASPTGPQSLHVNFQPAGTVPSGYAADTGAAYNGVSGWTDTAGNPINMTANTRKRNSTASPGPTYDTLILMQAPSGSGNTTPGRWTSALANGWYSVTVGVGDATATNSVNEVMAQPGTPQAKPVIDHFVPTSSTLFSTQTVLVDVENGALTLDPTGGSNTKLDFVDAVPAPADTTPPTVTITPSGVQASGPTDFAQQATVSISATDDRAVASLVYTLDGGPTTTYSGPFTVTGLGSHTVTATGTDTSKNATTQSSTFTISNPPPPTSAHIDFQAGTTGAAQGYLPSYGEPYTAARGYGWENQSTGLPADLTGNGRNRGSGLSPDHRYDTLVQMQQTTAQYGGTTTPGRFEVDVANGTYTVTVAVGDATATNSVYQINAQSGTPNAVTIINKAVPTSSNLFFTQSATVTVSNNALVLDAIGGSNTKIDFLDVVPYTAPDTTPPTVSFSLAGTAGTDPNTYTGDVGVTINAADNPGGSGLASVVYSLDGGPTTAYTGPFTVSSDGTHTVTATATDKAAKPNTTTTSTTWTQAEPARLSIASAADPVLGLPSSRMVFSSVANQAAQVAPNQQLTFTNTGGQTLTVSGFALAGSNASDFTLPGGSAPLSIAPGQSATVTVGFNPAAPTNCPTTSAPYALGNMARSGSLTFTTNDPSAPTAETLAGLVSCNNEGNNEPVLDQIFTTLGYTTVTAPAGTSDAGRRVLGAQRYNAGTDEINSPYFVSANPAVPVSITPIAHYSGKNTAAAQATGWFNYGAGIVNACSSACNKLWNFPPDTTTGYTQNQKLLPAQVGGTTFSPSGPFGIFSGDYTDVNFTDDSLNTAHDTSGNTISPPHYLHSMRVYPAYGPGHVLIPNTYLIGIDITRVPSYKNYDDQDVVLLVRNVAPMNPVAPSPGNAALNHNLAAGGTVTSSCQVTGFDGVLANNAGNQCQPSNISFGSGGLTLTSTAGQLATGDQQNALYDTFNAGQGAFVVKARVVGPVTGLTQNYQQIGAFFGPDTNNFIKAEIEHGGSGTDPHLTMFYDENGTASTIATVSLPAVTSASSVDLIIKGNTQVPDPTQAGSDPNTVRNLPLDELTVWYAINGGTPVQVGTVYESPANLATWFASNAKAGILVSNFGTTTPVQATFSNFSITTS